MVSYQISGNKTLEHQQDNPKMQVEGFKNGNTKINVCMALTTLVSFVVLNTFQQFFFITQTQILFNFLKLFLNYFFTEHIFYLKNNRNQFCILLLENSFLFQSGP